MKNKTDTCNVWPKKRSCARPLKHHFKGIGQQDIKSADIKFQLVREPWHVKGFNTPEMYEFEVSTLASAFLKLQSKLTSTLEALYVCMYLDMVGFIRSYHRINKTAGLVVLTRRLRILERWDLSRWDNFSITTTIVLSKPRILRGGDALLKSKLDT